jgi:hypothetical protein
VFFRALTLTVAAAFASSARDGHTQTTAPSGAEAVSTRPLPPATKLEAFTPTAGSVVILGYDELGSVGLSVSVDVRELRGADGTVARGLIVEVYESQYRRERAFVDADEIPELIVGIDALLAVKENPTSFKQFEVRYTTKGELRLTVFNTARGELRYAVRAGRTMTASHQMNLKELQSLRAMFVAAQAKLAETPR